jgi:hypothetical protein
VILPIEHHMPFGRNLSTDQADALHHCPSGPPSHHRERIGGAMQPWLTNYPFLISTCSTTYRPSSIVSENSMFHSPCHTTPLLPKERAHTSRHVHQTHSKCGPQLCTERILFLKDIRILCFSVSSSLFYPHPTSALSATSLEPTHINKDIPLEYQYSVCPSRFIYCDIWKLATLTASQVPLSVSSPTKLQRSPTSPRDNFDWEWSERTRLASTMSICTVEGAQESDELQLTQDQCLDSITELMRQQQILQ